MSSSKIATKSTRWSTELSQKAARDCSYIKCDEKGGRLLLSGAIQRWKDPNHVNDVYLPNERLTGSRTEVENILRTCGNYTDAQIRQAFESAYTCENVTGASANKKADYEREVADAKAAKPRGSSAKSNESKEKLLLKDVGDIVKAIPGAKKVSGRSNKSKAAETTESKGQDMTSEQKETSRKGRKIPIYERITKLPAGKVLDVSHMGDEGSLIKMIDRPKQSSLKMEVAQLPGCPALPIVSSDADKYEAILVRLRDVEGHPEFMPYLAAFRERYPNYVAERSNASKSDNSKSGSQPQIPSVPQVQNGQQVPAAPQIPNAPQITTKNVVPGNTTIPGVPQIPPLKSGGLNTNTNSIVMPKLPGLNQPRSPLKN